MVRAWFMKETTDEVKREEENFAKPGEFIDLETLRKLTGCYLHKVDPVNYEAEGKLAVICKEGNYNFQDEVELSAEKFGAEYLQKVNKFFIEHLHTDPEVRFTIAGIGYFDVRTAISDEWIRIEVVAGDLLYLPAGAYHRFTLATSRYIKVKRLFSGVPVWTSYPRTPLAGPPPVGYEEQSGDNVPARTKYLSEFTSAQP